MAVQTSSITTAANGNLAITPNGTGEVRVSTLSGSNNQPVGVDNNGELYKFLIGDLTAATPIGTDELMFDDAGVTRKASVQAIIDASDAISLADLSVTQNTASGAGALTYDNTTGVFTYTPPTIAGLGGIGLASLSVTTAATGTATGGLAYNNTTGVFTFTPVAGLSLTALSVTQNAAAGAGTLAYDNTNGVFTYTPPLLSGLGGIGLTNLSVTTAATGTATGGLAYDNTTGVFTYTPVAAGGIAAATHAEAAAGTLTTVYLSPATGVAKDAATTTGAALIPSGTDGQRPGSPVTGMVRHNTTSNVMEWYDGSTWVQTWGAGGGGFTGNVIYGVAGAPNFFAGTASVTVTHTSTPIANSFVLLHGQGGGFGGGAGTEFAVGAGVLSRSSDTQLGVSVAKMANASVNVLSVSYQIVY